MENPAITETEEFRALLRDILSTVNRIDDRTEGHSGNLEQISQSMDAMSRIDTNIERMATTLDKITDRAMTILEGKGVITIKSHLLTLTTSIVIVGLMFVIAIVAITKTNFSAETSGGSKASISQHP